MSGIQARAVVFGASAGAVQALSAILPRLPRGYPWPLLAVVHVPSGRSDMAPLFQSRCAIAVREPDDKEPIMPGTLYFAPPDYHLLVERDHSIALTMDDPVLFSRPSIDVLFESAAEIYGPGLTAVVLTGANEDGAAGARAVAAAGGTVLVEDPETALVAAMPSAAIAHCPTAHVLSLDAIADWLIESVAK